MIFGDFIYQKVYVFGELIHQKYILNYIII